MKFPGTGSMLDKLFYNLGYALGQAEALAGEAEVLDDGSTAESFAPPGDAPSHRSRAASAASAMRDAINPAAGLALGASAATWVLGRVLYPRPVRWPLVVLAGATGTALADLAERALAGDDGAAEAHFPPRLEDLPRYAAGVTTAAAYAAVAYPLLPGSPLMRALLFGALDAATREAGGAVGLLQRVAPRLPLEALSVLEPPRRAPISTLAFALGLALYRGKGRR